MTATAHTPITPDVAKGTWGRLYRGQTAIDFAGRRKFGFAISAVLIIITLLSLSTRELNLGIDFEGGVSWDVPSDDLTIDDATHVLTDNGLSTSGARIQQRGAEDGGFIKVQVEDQPADVREAVRADLAEAAGVSPDEVSVNAVSATWGSEITDKAIRALVIFLLVVAAFISLRFEWRMALAAIIAMVHDVLISVGIYSLFGFVVTPATVIAFLTILGYSLYDTIVVFDKVRENEARYAAHRLPYDDVVNISMNQVLMRSLNTSLSSIIPVLSLLIVGAGILGVTTLSEFAIALLVGMLTGAYSSIFVATPLLGILKARDPRWRGVDRARALREDLRALVIGGSPVTARRVRQATSGATRADGPAGASAATAAAATTSTTSSTTPTTATDLPGGARPPASLLTHPPRPRKKKRR
jgi:preprotein translocase subunit SecF